jgi:HAD superfamily hydrolase (TIGR01662 family)
MRAGSVGPGRIGWGVPRHVFSSVFGAVIARGQDYRETFQVFQPGFDLEKARQQRADEGKPEWFGERDLYPDARPALAALRAAGLWVGIAGNQTARAGGILRDLGLPADMIATSDDWGVTKPDPGFFRRMIEASPCDPDQTLYVGDRLDKDIVPAAEVGLRTALIKRGPWAMIWQDDPAASRVPTLRIDSLAELPGKIAAFNAGGC